MADFLLFRLYGPMASWGDIAVGEYRPSFAHPSKSAIVGLLAAAIGIRRDEEDRQRELADGCLFAVRVDAMGFLLRDYHTVQSPSAKKGIIHYTRRSELSGEDINTILSSRDYRCDALYTVAITSRETSPYSAQALAEKLRKPGFVLYLGRKSCPPALPLYPKVVAASTFKEALKKADFPTDDCLDGATSSPVGVYWEDGIESGYDSEHVITRRDMPISRKRWQFNERHENYAGL